MEANLALTGKSRVKQEPTKPKRGKEEASSSGRDRESSNPKWDYLARLIKSLSKKVGKLEIENKNLSRHNDQVNNWGYNPQYRRPPLQLLPRERNEKLDHIPHPLYSEDGPNEQSSDT